MRILFNILFAVLALRAGSQVMWQFNKDTVVTWNYEWGDEFEGDKVDEQKWGYWYGWARSIYPNKEQQYYTDGKNHEVSNGTLKLVARKEGVDARMVDWLPDTDTLKVENKFYGLNKMHFNYTSGMIRSTRDFLYGYFEIRFRAPKDRGTWPAFWIYGGDPNEEIDIMELKGERPTQIHVDTHCPNDCDYFRKNLKKTSWGGWIKLSGKLHEGFNVVSGEWRPGSVKYYVNGKFIAQSNVDFKIPKAVVANVALPSDNGPFKPGPKKDFTVSEPFEIDYIRAWTLASGQGRPRVGAGEMLVPLPRLKAAAARMAKRDKFLFGRKKDHLAEGPTVSWMPAGPKKFVLYALGLGAGQEVKMILKDQSGKEAASAVYKEFGNFIDLSQFSGSFTLSLSCNGRTVALPLSL
jgi:beta-glucanase (GH16 family)